jgi:hypothetical protein
MKDYVYLLDGEVIHVDHEDGRFVVLIPSTEEEISVRKPFSVQWMGEKFLLFWIGRNGQRFALPIREDA